VTSVRGTRWRRTRVVLAWVALSLVTAATVAVPAGSAAASGGIRGGERVAAEVDAEGRTAVGRATRPARAKARSARVEALTASVPVVTAALVQPIIDTWRWSPASPDPSGVVYLPALGRLQIADSEVDETTGAGYHGVNLWQVNASGSVLDTGTTLAWSTPSKEPTGLGHDPGPNLGSISDDTLFVSDDPKAKVWIVRPGPDGRFGTADDPVSSFDAGAAGSTDTEDPEFDPVSGHLFFLDGAQTRIYDIDPVNGVFGDGNDVVTSFNLAFGPTDYEGLGSDQANGTLLVGARKEKKIYEITKTGSLVRIIDASGISGFKFISGLGMAPSSTGSGMSYWIVDRNVDNGSNSNENDGHLVEIALEGSTNTPPIVTNPGTKTNTEGDAVSYQIEATDPDGDAITSFGASGLPTGLVVDPGTGLITGTTTTAGSYAVTISATDDRGGVGSTSFTWNVNPAGGTPPTITGFSPTSGPIGTSVTISGSDFTGASDVLFNGASVQGAFAVDSDTQITATVPSGATTGPISVVTPDGTGTSSADFTVTGTGSTLTFAPDADAYVLERRPDKNFGSKPTLLVDGSPPKHSLITFTVSGVGGATVTSVKLRLYCTNSSNAGGDFFRTSGAWQEGSVTWNTAPPPEGTALASLGSVATGTWYEVDVSSFVTGDGTYSLRITSLSGNGADYVSKEGTAGLAPELVVTLG